MLRKEALRDLAPSSGLTARFPLFIGAPVKKCNAYRPPYQKSS
jgi:hypothetical protein